MADWDAAGLPDFVSRDGYQEGFKDTMLRSPQSIGPAKVRRRSTNAVEPATHRVELTSAELTTFKTFFETTLAGGTISFTKTHPRTGVETTYRFTKTPDPATPIGNDYMVLLNLEVLP